MPRTNRKLVSKSKVVVEKTTQPKPVAMKKKTTPKSKKFAKDLQVETKNLKVIILYFPLLAPFELCEWFFPVAY